jgi:hypothetical protein
MNLDDNYSFVSQESLDAPYHISRDKTRAQQKGKDPSTYCSESLGLEQVEASSGSFRLELAREPPH